MDGSPPSARARSRALFALACLVCFCIFGWLSAVGVSTGRADEAAPEAVPGQLVVGFKPTVSDRQQQQAVDKAGGTIQDTFDSRGSAVVSVDPGRTDTAAQALANQKAVQYVEPNYVVHASRVPDDRLFDEQWGLRNVGQYGGTAGADVHATEAWDVTTGANTTVAVVDTGLDYTHPDLSSNTWDDPANPTSHGANFIADGSTPMDDAGHGTHVAGIIGAKGNNVTGVSGVNWDAKIMALKFLDKDGNGNTADAANAIDYAVSHGARVINASWGGPAYSQALYQAIQRASAKGVLLVAAAGNDGQNADVNPEYPASFDLPNIISVAASDPSDRLVDFSNYGPVSVDLAAPGDNIVSTVPTATDPSGYASFSGTSMATPFVAGAAALYLSRYPQATGDQARTAILQNVDKLPTLAGKVATGGRLDIAKALGYSAPPPAAQPSSNRTPPTPFVLIRPTNRRHVTRRTVRFRWQASHAATGIKYYKLYINGRRVKTIRDPDRHPGGKDPKTSVRMRIGGGRHTWFVRAWDYQGNRRTSRTFRKGRYARKSLFYVSKPGPTRHARVTRAGR